MTNSAFRVTEHVLPCYRARRCAAESEATPVSVSLAVKQYVPVESHVSGQAGITIIAAHANACPKELYEPLWEALAKSLHTRGLGIRAIWIADVAHQNRSGILNEEHGLLTNVRWNDHVRDMIRMIDHFHDGMVKPIVAIGHSMGGSQVLSLAAACPDIFSSVILLDPAIGPVWAAEGCLLLARRTLTRIVEWESPQKAKDAARKSFRTWDAAVLSRYEAYGLVEETSAGSSAESRTVKLVNGRYRELIGFLQPQFIDDGDVTSPEIKYQRGCYTGYNALESIESNLLFLCGANSPATPERLRQNWFEKLAGNDNNIRTAARFVPDTGHFLPFEAPHDCGEAIADWVAEETTSWAAREKQGMPIASKGKSEKESMSDAWMVAVKAKLS
ncbi:Alpha/Beta hydrolase protein [Rhexocercosporidium sp. MPI-PUGE-AT-0058]|nr:Alpha/Beta hydrolase protein [Rhexocercosporidium sp. MPI-PUGE-AT-0058]